MDSGSRQRIGFRMPEPRRDIRVYWAPLVKGPTRV